ncbi:MAG: adenylate kinase family protein [Candidatus Aenigmatarchaeota archaeon]
MLIAITGTPGTGKTTVSKKLSEYLSYEYVSVNDLARKKGYIIGKDEERDAEEVDIVKLRGLELVGDKVLDGHLSHFIPSDITIVLRCRPDVLKKRIQGKGWNDEKVQENLEAEILGIISSETKSEQERVHEIDNTSKSPDETVEEIIDVVDGDESIETIDWLEGYQDMLSTDMNYS